MFWNVFCRKANNIVIKIFLDKNKEELVMCENLLCEDNNTQKSSFVLNREKPYIKLHNGGLKEDLKKILPGSF